VVGRWHFLVVVAVSVLAFATTAQAAPVFLSAIDISDAGQDGFGPQVKIDSSGNVHSVWTRSDGANFRIQYSTRTPSGAWSAPVNISDPGQGASNPQLAIDPSNNILAVWSRSDGTNLRIQAAYKPSAGAFAAPVTVSDPGFDAFKPAVDMDGTGKAIAVWSRFDGTNIRVQGTTRTAGSGGTFANEVTLSAPGQDANDPVTAAGPNVDNNGVVSWYRSDGTKLRVQSARRRDVVGYPRPSGAGPLRASLVPAYNACVTANRTHGPSLAYPSCNPPTRPTTVLTVGTPDANGFSASSASSMRFRVVVGNPATESNEADVQTVINVNDVRCATTLVPACPSATAGADYTGRVGISVNLQITDQRNAAEQPDHGTVQSFPLQWSVQCAATVETTKGAACATTTSLNALLPGAVLETRRTIWELGQVTVRDAGANGTGYAACPPTCGDGDEATYMRQGIFVP
jgi:hypothetical protein